jgi:hypothetical protein
MKKLFIILCLLLLCFIPANAGIITVINNSSMAVTGGAGPDAWYYSVGTDGSDYASSASITNTWEIGDNITIGQGGSLTKISVKIGTPTEGTDIKIILLYNNAGTWTKVECGEMLNVTADSWNDFTLVTPYTVTTSQSVMVVAIPSELCGISYATTSGGHYQNSKTYSSYCDLTTITWNNDYSYAVRVYVD